MNLETLCMTATTKLEFPEPGDDKWPPCGDFLCWRRDGEWWPEVLEQRELDNADAGCTPQS